MCRPITFYAECHGQPLTENENLQIQSMLFGFFTIKWIGVILAVYYVVQQNLTFTMQILETVILPCLIASGTLQ